MRVCARVCARMGVHARACLCMRAFVCACECGLAVPSASIFARVLCVCFACVCGTTVRVRLGAEWALWGHEVLIARPAAAARARLRIGATGCRCRARSAAGRTFSSRTLKAGWAARYRHTSVVDAVSGAIYVIGGQGTTRYNGVWASTNGGARPDLVEEGGATGYSGGNTGY
jgi:hypothetical protein